MVTSGAALCDEAAEGCKQRSLSYHLDLVTTHKGMTLVLERGFCLVVLGLFQGLEGQRRWNQPLHRLLLDRSLPSKMPLARDRPRGALCRTQITIQLHRRCGSGLLGSRNVPLYGANTRRMEYGMGMEWSCIERQGSPMMTLEGNQRRNSQPAT